LTKRGDQAFAQQIGEFKRARLIQTGRKLTPKRRILKLFAGECLRQTERHVRQRALQTHAFQRVVIEARRGSQSGQNSGGAVWQFRTEAPGQIIQLA
jgi:hypothetical protein